MKRRGENGNFLEGPQKEQIQLGGGYLISNIALELSEPPARDSGRAWIRITTQHPHLLVGKEFRLKEPLEWPIGSCCPIEWRSPPPSPVEYSPSAVQVLIETERQFNYPMTNKDGVCLGGGGPWTRLSFLPHKDTFPGTSSLVQCSQDRGRGDGMTLGGC